MTMLPRMSLVAALQELQRRRTDGHVVIPTMGAAREWLALEPHPLDFAYVPSAMGAAPALGLGLALAQPQRRIIVANGDGCMLMNLGSLVTIAAAAPPNFVLLVCDNGVYEVTGGQRTAGAEVVGGVRWGEVARGCGWRRVYEIADLGDWTQQLPEILEGPGPVFAVLRVAPIPEGRVPQAPGDPRERTRAWSAALAAPTRPV